MQTDTDFWNKIAEKYSRQPIANPSAWQRKLEFTRARLRPTDRILDIGCGTGSLALELAPHVAEVHAVDLSSEMLEIGRRKARDQGVENVHFHESTVEGLSNFEAESFDGVCAFSILHLVDDRPRVLENLFSLLKPGGFLISSTVCLGGSLVPYGLILPLMRFFRKAPSVQVFRRDVVISDIRNAGFAEVEEVDVGAQKEVAFVVATKPGNPPA